MITHDTVGPALDRLAETSTDYYRVVQDSNGFALTALAAIIAEAIITLLGVSLTESGSFGLATIPLGIATCLAIGAVALMVHSIHVSADQAAEASRQDDPAAFSTALGEARRAVDADIAEHYDVESVGYSDADLVHLAHTHEMPSPNHTVHVSPETTVAWSVVYDKDAHRMVFRDTGHGEGNSAPSVTPDDVVRR